MGWMVPYYCVFPFKWEPNSPNVCTCVCLCICVCVHVCILVCMCMHVHSCVCVWVRWVFLSFVSPSISPTWPSKIRHGIWGEENGTQLQSDGKRKEKQICTGIGGYPLESRVFRWSWDHISLVWPSTKAIKPYLWCSGAPKLQGASTVSRYQDSWLGMQQDFHNYSTLLNCLSCKNAEFNHVQGSAHLKVPLSLCSLAVANHLERWQQLQVLYRTQQRGSWGTITRPMSSCSCHENPARTKAVTLWLHHHSAGVQMKILKYCQTRRSHFQRTGFLYVVECLNNQIQQLHPVSLFDDPPLSVIISLDHFMDRELFD